MKRNRAKLVLHRETLHSLENLRHAVGGASLALCGEGGGTRYCEGGGTYGICGNTYENCSNTCATGGACTT